MQITLRKANAIQNAIQEAIKSIDIKLNFELNEFQSVDEVLATANETLYKNDARREALLLALYNIRALVGVANSTSGIDTKLTLSAFIDKRIIQLEEISKVPPATDTSELVGKLEKIRSRVEESRFGYSKDTVVTTVVSKEQIDAAKDAIKELKKQKLVLADEVLELNIKTEIPLTDDVVDTLKAEGIL